jgi:hypothetical protein
MARYIDADALLNKMPDDLPYKASVKRVLIQAPTADVAPKSEVERLQHILDSYALQYGTVKDQHEVIDKVKTEVAREIFEEIEKAISNLEYRANTPRKTVRVEELKAQVDWVLHEVVPKTIAELKKKYKGEQT